MAQHYDLIVIVIGSVPAGPMRAARLCPTVI
jgi:hypothetical protein